MRWIPLILLIYVVLIVQTTIGGILTFRIGGFGTVGVDFMAILAVFVAVHGRNKTSVGLGVYLMGLALDLTTAGAGNATVIGAMPIAYVVAGTVIHSMRDAFFRERAIPQMVMGFIFCIIAYPIWITLQSLLGSSGVGGWSLYGRRILQGVALGVYTGLLTPLGHLGLIRIRRWIVTVPPGRRGRRRR